jgi:hypothetical protein
MNWGIIGLPRVGKTTLFQVLTRARPQESHQYGQAQHLGVVVIPDERMDRLAQIIRPAKVTYATAEFVDAAALRQETMKESAFLQSLRTLDGLVHVVRLFHNEAVAHAQETLDPRRDLMNVEADLILADLGVVENRLERLEKDRKKIKSADLEREQDLFELARQWLESGNALREVPWSEAEKRQLRGFSFLSEKPMLVVLNVDDEQAGKLGEVAASEEFAALRKRPRMRVEAIAGTIEAELATLSDSEAPEFLASYGLTELGSKRILRATLELLDLITFFTLGDKECRAWLIPRGSTALQAAGAIHTDIEKHFIRAETVGWEQFLQVGGWAGTRSEGVLKLEGKEYVVKDGEVLNIRHSG